MPKIELWEKAGKGVFRALHNMKRPVEVVALEDADGNLYPIYEGHNEIPTGIYNIVTFRAYTKEDENVVNDRGGMRVEAWNENDVIYLVNAGEFLGGYYPYKDARWEEYVASKGDKLERPIGWNPQSAQRILLDAKKRMRG